MADEIILVDRGRGMQLPTNRITVMDLVQYFLRGCSYEEIIQWIPILTPEEIAVVEAYYQEHKEELDEKNRRVQEHREEQSRLQRIRFPEPTGTREEIINQFRELMRIRRKEKNGERNPT